MRVCMQANTRAIVSKYERSSQYDSKYVSLHESQYMRTNMIERYELRYVSKFESMYVS